MSTAAIHERQFYAQYIGTTVRLPVDGGVHSTNGLAGDPAPLAAGGRYAILCPDTAVYIRQGGAGVSASAADRLLPRGTFAIINTDDVTNNRVAVTAAAGLGGFLYITRIDSLTGNTTGAAATHKEIFFASFIGPTAKIAAGAASAMSAQFVHGARYLVYCPEIDPAGVDGQIGDDVWIRQGSWASGITVSDTPGATLGMPLPRGMAFFVNVDDGTTDALAVLSATGGNGSSVFVVRVDSI
jgi:hypothetical protein